MYCKNPVSSRPRPQLPWQVKFLAFVKFRGVLARALTARLAAPLGRATGGAEADRGATEVLVLEGLHLVRCPAALPPPPRLVTAWQSAVATALLYKTVPSCTVLYPEPRQSTCRHHEDGSYSLQEVVPPPLPYKVDTSRPSLRTNWTRLVRRSRGRSGRRAPQTARCERRPPAALRAGGANCAFLTLPTYIP